ncbi:FtsK/SpoIIIE domain-containing protein [Actinoplanes sp. NPDC049802]|uniref:FtsK/SpoIIIE domain-containing protein n=1 Tax=Actinoplanes sp. NPDC049802 TaxID=3154742 RepID=UPI003400DA94
MPLLKPEPTPSISELPGIVPGSPGLHLDYLAALGHDLIPYGIFAGLLLVAWAVAGAVLARKAPHTWWLLYGFWFLRLRMGRSWQRLCLNAGLTTASRRAVPARTERPVLPLLIKVRPRRNGATAMICFSAGQTPAQFIEAADAMAHAWRVHAVRAIASGRGRVKLTILNDDPLMGIPESLGTYLQRASLRQAGEAPTMDDLVATVGSREDGERWTINLLLFPHWLITGATQSGKSTLINAAVSQWATRPVALVGIDCKGGMELGPHAPRLSALATDRQQAASLLERLVREANRRMVLCRDHQHRNIWQLPKPLRPVPVIVIVDELAELYLVASRDEKEAALKATTNLLRLAQLGAALGIHLVVAGQRVGSDFGAGVTALRAQLGGRICLAVNDKETAVMTLGDLYPDAVEAAQLISPAEKGVAITTAEWDGWIRARSINFPPDALDAAMEAAAHLAPSLPGIDSALL